MGSRILSEGALLLRAAGTLAEVAAATEVPRSTLSSLRTGALPHPSDRVAGVLEERLKIPRAAWSTFPAGELSPTEEPSQPPQPPGSGVDHIFEPASPSDVLRRARANLERLEANGAHPRDLTAAISEYRQAVTLARKVREDDAEELLATIRKALEPFPEAREAIARALEGEA